MELAKRNIALLLVLAACAACDADGPSRQYRNQAPQRDAGERDAAQSPTILERLTPVRDAEHVPDAGKSDKRKSTGQGRICRPCGNWVRNSVGMDTT